MSEETWFEPFQVMLLVSKRRRGKSTVATVIASYFERSSVLFVDVKRRYKVHQAVVCNGSAELQAVTAPLPMRIQFIPAAVATPTDKKAEEREWHELFEWVAAQQDLCVLLDECTPKPAGVTTAPGSLKKVVAQKAVDRVGMIACNGRWRGVIVELRSHADVIGLWPGGLARDEREDAAREMNMSADELQELLDRAAALGDHAFILFDRNRDLVRIVPPLDEHLRARAIATELTP